MVIATPFIAKRSMTSRGRELHSLVTVCVSSACPLAKALLDASMQNMALALINNHPARTKRVNRGLVPHRHRPPNSMPQQISVTSVQRILC